jgi:hypothetical protein
MISCVFRDFIPLLFRFPAVGAKIDVYLDKEGFVGSSFHPGTPFQLLYLVQACSISVVNCAVPGRPSSSKKPRRELVQNLGVFMYLDFLSVSGSGPTTFRNVSWSFWVAACPYVALSFLTLRNYLERFYRILNLVSTFDRQEDLDFVIA